MKKIALISEHASPLAAIGGVDSGGQNIYVAHVARQLGRLGHVVDVFTRREESSAADVVPIGDGVRVIHVPAGPNGYLPKEKLLPYMPAFGAWLCSFFQRERRRQHGYDLMHANFFMSGLAALRARRILGIPLVITFHALGRVRRLHQGSSDGFPDQRFDIEEVLAQSCDRIVAECQQDRRDLIAHYGAHTERIDVVPCGFDAEEFFPQNKLTARMALGWDPMEFAVLQLGRLVPRKGIDNVILALAKLRQRYGINARLHVVGGNSDLPDETSTPEIGRLRRLAAEAGVSDRVVFAGRRARDRLRLYYAAADVFVTTPWYEPFGITPVEAMACARPVIGSAVGGIRSTVVNGHTGLLVPPRDPDALAECLHTLSADPTLAERMGVAGLERVRRSYTWHGVARRIERVYERALRSMQLTIEREHDHDRPFARESRRMPVLSALGRATASRAAGEGLT